MEEVETHACRREERFHADEPCSRAEHCSASRERLTFAASEKLVHGTLKRTPQLHGSSPSQ